MNLRCLFIWRWSIITRTTIASVRGIFRESNHFKGIFFLEFWDSWFRFFRVKVKHVLTLICCLWNDNCRILDDIDCIVDSNYHSTMYLIHLVGHFHLELHSIRCFRVNLCLKCMDHARHCYRCFGCQLYDLMWNFSDHFRCEIKIRRKNWTFLVFFVPKNETCVWRVWCTYCSFKSFEFECKSCDEFSMFVGFTNFVAVGKGCGCFWASNGLEFADELAAKI